MQRVEPIFMVVKHFQALVERVEYFVQRLLKTGTNNETLSKDVDLIILILQMAYNLSI